MMMRLKNEIAEGTIEGIYREYPLLKDDKIMWPEKFKSMEDIEKKKRVVGDNVSWSREYLLKIIDDKNQIIRREWIKYWDHVNTANLDIFFGVDPAISQKETADYFVTAVIGVDKDTGKIYLLDYKRDRLTIDNQVSTIINLFIKYKPLEVGIETVAYQQALRQLLEKIATEQRVYIKTRELKTDRDKVRRMGALSALMEQGSFYIKRDMEDFVTEALEFPMGKHDDIVDAVMMAIETARQETKVEFKFL
jgi:predicted phage terminase large subunit-like protein